MANGSWIDDTSAGTGVGSAGAWLKLNGTAGTRSWYLSAQPATHDFSAGGSVTVTVNLFTSGITPPLVPDTLTVEFYEDSNTSTMLGSVTLTPGAATQSLTIYLSSTPNAAGGAARCGLLRANLHAVNTTGGAGNTYNVDSDGVHTTPPTGGNVGAARSVMLRSNTTVALTASTASGGSHTPTFGYSDTVWANLALGCAKFGGQSESVTFALSGTSYSSTAGTVAASASSGASSVHAVDNTFPVAATSSTLSTTISNATATVSGAAAPWMVATSTTNDTSTIDPRLTFSYLHQDNDNAWGTPPTVKDVGAQRLASDLAFLAARVVNANGVGINGITWTAKLYDHGQLVWTPAAPYKSVSVTSQAQGGQAGWGNAFMVWDSQLPPGLWDKTEAITAPAGATGLELSASTQYTLIAANPNLRILAAGGPATTAVDARHFTPGDSFLAGIAVINVKTMTLQAMDTSPAPAVAIGRFNLTLGRAEFLASDGVTWNPATGGSVYFHPCTVSPGDANVYTKTFSSTSTWGNADLFIVGSAYVGGVPVNDFYKEIVVNGINNHDKYAFDGAGFVGFPFK